MALNSDQALALAEQVQSASADVRTFLNNNWDQLTEDEREVLKAQERELFESAAVLRTDAVDLALEEAQTDIEALQGLIGKAKDTLQTVDNIRTGIKVAAALVGLGQSLATRDVGGIANNAKAIFDAVAA